MNTDEAVETAKAMQAPRMTPEEILAKVAELNDWLTGEISKCAEDIRASIDRSRARRDGD